MKEIEKQINRAYFSPGTECLNAILDSINNAEYSLKICVFTISDDRITAAIIKAHQEGVQVRLLTDNEKLFDKGSDIRELAAAGIETRVDVTQYHMHHKFAIIDNEALLTGSYNWTRSAANYNHENLLVTNQRDIVTSYLLEFDKLWDEMPLFDE
ncbi:DUF1669 domain-containing protein [Pontibacter sp. BT310]|uniref:phospholipase D n=1 Tax=Pontibacter populi TaxID=890055 RepID=A0ABS6XAD9_9BACT|nr:MULTISPECIES: phospholipase D-like domain-containing protein [Pontibacter]MBJ6118119.1 DUF1669 domain-containing protein [Pontibacter sp. BT310]MBR0570546.1 DUF1669 domain-containing protein [Microvirga sp. STS03]MBW3364972.1 DUF1669 domain-containing protein [Pontibacter populi]